MLLRRLLAKAKGPPVGYFSPRNAYARQMGEDAAVGLSVPWREAERVLQGIWRQESGGMTWDSARPIVRYAWRLTKEAMARTETQG